MYHVSKAENAKQIFTSGLQSKPPDKNWVNDREEMREQLDQIANKEYTNWVNRKDAIFFWPNYQKAVRYAERYLEPAIVEVDTSGLTVWCMRNTSLENLFDTYVNENEFDKKQAEMIIQNAREWTGSRDEDIEAWTSSPIDSKRINQITDINGQIIDLD